MKFWKPIISGKRYIDKYTNETVIVDSTGWILNNTLFPWVIVKHYIAGNDLGWLIRVSRIEFINKYNELQ